MTTAREARPSAGVERERQVRRIFSEIAPRYDLLNHVLSLNADRRWRRRAVDRLEWEASPGGLYLDACAGTYDLGLELGRPPGFSREGPGIRFCTPNARPGTSKDLPGHGGARMR
jgi:demethylmenaquinone methyltransferase / 2-methoxy-6-polyprenyl-1,4-benzoquinol methylase